MRKVIISVAPVAAGTPVESISLAEDVKKCVEMGASMCHLHCRKPDGSLTPDTNYMIEDSHNIIPYRKSFLIDNLNDNFCKDDFKNMLS